MSDHTNRPKPNAGAPGYAPSIKEIIAKAAEKLLENASEKAAKIVPPQGGSGTAPTQGNNQPKK